ncbi:thymidylate kinase [Paenibacillus cellulosilyticus]|uniref:Thymidylate kinase n=1 Tax=Paenibacillus cellulosilyticus TaxID=375489 RepID=A0A2V2YY40_9BACL|nr:hypothetical protein [Paenibacillus cellulosilyticus]PWW06553.1 thymidylate kinase [Paenibacillus cellulosilyticus]QKS46111.1 hypothetical protein HUB94_17985 [Paenibacillus cellulosilyticus]
MEQRNKQLIIIDGMPGSGKTTCASMLGEKLTAWNIPSRCILEQEPQHPLFIHGYRFESLEEEEQADLYIGLLQQRYRDFVEERLQSEQQVTIIESVMLQDTINCAHHMGMNREKLIDFVNSLQETLAPLSPMLVYFYHLNVEGQWRFICGVRGNEWGPVSLHTDEDFREAGALWGASQAFVRSVVDEWDIPKLIIENRDYTWDEYTNRIVQFVEANVR